MIPPADLLSNVGLNKPRLYLIAFELQIDGLHSFLLSHDNRSLIQAPTRFELNRIAEGEIVTRYGPLISRNVHPHTFMHSFAINSVQHEVQVCDYCGGNGSIDLAVCSKCLEKRKEAPKRSIFGTLNALEVQYRLRDLQKPLDYLIKLCFCECLQRLRANHSIASHPELHFRVCLVAGASTIEVIRQCRFWRTNEGFSKIDQQLA
jgi:hypothetical protein